MNNLRSIRKDWDLIESLIKDNSRILDIGCGEGDLIRQLEKNLSAKVHGIEKSRELAIKGIAKGDGKITAVEFLKSYPNNTMAVNVPALMKVVNKVESIKELMEFFSDSPLENL